MAFFERLTWSGVVLIGWMVLTPAAFGQPSPQGCTVDLIADGRDTAADAGDVSVAPDGDGTWTVTLTAAALWMIETIHVHASCEVDGFPLTSKGAPMVGRFAYTRGYDPPVKQATVVVDDPGCCTTGGPTLFAAHAEVVDSSSCHGKRCRGESAWGDGLRFPGSSWATYFPCQCLEACCLADGSCTDLSATECQTAGADPQGPDTDCASFAGCPQACCFSDDSCFDLPPGFCEPAGGTSKGPGRSCATSPCTRACCMRDGTCADLEREECEMDAYNQALGPATTCATAECLTEACCAPDFFPCADFTLHACAYEAGTSQGPGTVCTPTTCTEACCMRDGTCADIKREECEMNAYNQALGPGTTCATAECLTEACCAPDFFPCADVTLHACAFEAGTPQGPGTVCTPTTCTEACCMGDGTCADLEREECELDPDNNEALGPGTTCATAECLTEACCALDFDCADLTLRACAFQAGTSLGPGTVCATSTCNQACCMSDGTCQELLELECETAGGSAQGLGTDCSGIQPCPPVVDP